LRASQFGRISQRFPIPNQTAILKTLAASILVLLSACTGLLPKETSFKDKDARFGLCNGRYCALVDANGELVTPRLFNKLYAYKGPLALYVRSDNTWGAINRAGVTVFRATYLAPSDGDYLQGSMGDGYTQLYDMSGRVVAKRPITSGMKNWGFRLWGGHHYFFACKESESEPDCKTTFFNSAGNTLAEFSSFKPYNNDGKLAIVGAGGDRLGVIDNSLRFVVEPGRYRWIDKRDYYDMATVRNAAGVGVLDAAGRDVVAPGIYKSVYVNGKNSLIAAFKPGDSNCTILLRRDGSEIKLPPGVCGESMWQEDAGKRGYALVRDKQQGLSGVIDLQGRLLMPPRYAELTPLNAQRLVFTEMRFGSDAKKFRGVRGDRYYGVIDLTGKIILSPQPAEVGYYSSSLEQYGVLRDVFIARTENGVGLLDRNGHWLVKDKNWNARVLSPDLIAFDDKQDRIWKFYTAGGKQLALTSVGDPQPVWPKQPDEKPRWFVFSREIKDVQPNGVDTTWPRGVADFNANIIIPPGKYDEVFDAGDGLFRVKRGYSYGVVDAQGREIIAPAFHELYLPFIQGAALAQSDKEEAVLINTHGKVLASFNALFPDIAHRDDGDAIVTQTLDVCYNLDPTAEPGDPSPLPPLAQKICADNKLRAQSRETEKRYYNAQAGNCLPQNFEALRPAYDKALAACGNTACMANAMSAFQRTIATEAKRCEANVASIEAGAAPVPPAVQTQLRKLIAAGGNDLDDGEVASTINFQPLKLGKQPAVLATAETTAHNGPFWLFLPPPSGKGQWRMVLSDYSGYLRPLEPTDSIQHGLPVLRTQQHASCCEHVVTYFAYDGKNYQSVLSCQQLYDGDGTAVLFCGRGEEGESEGDAE
jgi:hypothetical protein